VGGSRAPGRGRDRGGDVGVIVFGTATEPNVLPRLCGAVAPRPRRFAGAGVRLVLIGQATPPQAAHFRRMQGIDVPVLADAERVTYRAAGAKIATMDELLGPRVVAKGVVAMAKHRVFQGRKVGDFAQLGGAMIVDRDGTIVWSHMSEDASDIAPATHILAGLRALEVAPAKREETVGEASLELT